MAMAPLWPWQVKFTPLGLRRNRKNSKRNSPPPKPPLLPFLIWPVSSFRPPSLLFPLYLPPSPTGGPQNPTGGAKVWAEQMGHKYRHPSLHHHPHKHHQRALLKQIRLLQRQRLVAPRAELSIITLRKTRTCSLLCARLGPLLVLFFSSMLNMIL